MMNLVSLTSADGGEVIVASDALGVAVERFGARARRRAARVLVLVGACATLGFAAGAPARADPPAGPWITDYAGTGTAATANPGPATSSPLNAPTGVAVDAAGNVYIADTNNNLVEKVTPGGTLSIIAGDGTSAPPIAGPAISSPLNGPAAVAVDAAGNVYIADSYNNVVEKVTPGGMLSIIAGDGTHGAPILGAATSSHLFDPEGVAVDAAGDVYISDQNNSVVEKVTPGGTLSIVAGNGASSGAPIPGPATSSPIGDPGGVAVDAGGNLYISDYGPSVVDKVTPGGTLSVIAGDGTYGNPAPGPATSSDLAAPWGVAVDASGNVYIATEGTGVAAKVNPGGTLSIIVGNGTYGPPTYGGPATSSPMGYAEGVAVNADGTVYIADTSNSTVDRVGLATPGAPGQPVLTAGDESAQLSFTAPIDPGTGAITGYQVSLDGGATWQAITTTPGTGGTLTATLDGLTDGSSYSVLVRAVNDSGNGAPSPSAPVTPEATPRDTVLPAISGNPVVAATLTASTGVWQGGGLTYSYQWLLDGDPISGATVATYALTTGDGGHRISVQVTATNAIGEVSATSTAVTVPAPATPTPVLPVTSPVPAPVLGTLGCPKPNGRLAGTTLGPLTLGLTRLHARQRLQRFTVTANGFDNFCLYGGSGIRVGYPSAKLLHTLTADQRTHMAKTIVIALTSNPYYQLDGTRPGTRLAGVQKRLRVPKAIHIGLNYWYITPGHAANGVLKVRHGVIQEIGIANKQLTDGRKAQQHLLNSFN